MGARDQLALDLPGIADTATKSAIAALSLIGVLLVVLGLVRSWLARRRPQVVVEDIVPVEGVTDSVMTGVSRQLRQAVGQVLRRESRDASHSVLETLERDIGARLLKADGRMRVKALRTGLRSTMEDSLSSLAAGIRGIAPAESDGLLAALSAALPAQRGWIVRTSPALRGTGTDAELGLTLEFGRLGRPADSITTFWASSDSLREATGEDEQAVATRALLHQLIEPAARWIATRLVARQLAKSEAPIWRRLLSGRRQRQDLAGLQLLLAGQLSLYAMQELHAFDRGFADQALADLAEAKDLLPHYFRPHLAEGGVRERLGWSYRRSDHKEEAEREFARAVVNYFDALEALADANSADPMEREAAISRVKVRQTKCRLLSGDPADALVARKELAELNGAKVLTPLALYNAACLFSIAMSLEKATAMSLTIESAGDGERYARNAWVLLGQALLMGGRNGPWERAISDEELEAMGRPKLIAFRTELKRRHPTLEPLKADEAQRIVDKALVAIEDHPAA